MKRICRMGRCWASQGSSVMRVNSAAIRSLSKIGRFVPAAGSTMLKTLPSEVSHSYQYLSLSSIHRGDTEVEWMSRRILYGAKRPASR